MTTARSLVVCSLLFDDYLVIELVFGVVIQTEWIEFHGNGEVIYHIEYDTRVNDFASFVWFNKEILYGYRRSFEQLTSAKEILDFCCEEDIELRSG